MRFDKVIAKIIKVHFFASQCRIHHSHSANFRTELSVGSNDERRAMDRHIAIQCRKFSPEHFRPVIIPQNSSSDNFLHHLGHPPAVTAKIWKLPLIRTSGFNRPTLTRGSDTNRPTRRDFFLKSGTKVALRIYNWSISYALMIDRFIL